LCNADGDLAQDLTQDAFLRFLTSGAIAKVSTGDDAVAYLRAIVRNLVRDYYRQRFLHPMISVDAIGASELESALNRVVQRSITDIDFALIPDLRDEDRVLLRFTIEGLSITEVAEQLGLTYSAAAVRLHRLRKYLRGTCKKNDRTPVLRGKRGIAP
jgi:RNA polymerase sigma factor (sigma-70 family)